MSTIRKKARDWRNEALRKLIHQWDEGARAQRCLDAGCLTPNECILNGCPKARSA